jgi:hypothetical protein
MVDAVESANSCTLRILFNRYYPVEQCWFVNRPEPGYDTKPGMNTLRLTYLLLTLSLLAACGREPPPRTVKEFAENPILLEATMVRCGQDRSRTKYDAECVNAREAANKIAVVDEEARKKSLQAQFERKRKQLRRTQQAATEARQRAADERRRLEEAKYFGEFESTPGEQGQVAARSMIDPEQNSGEHELAGNEPGMVVGPAPEETDENAEPDSTEQAADIDAIREELKRRQDSTG